MIRVRGRNQQTAVGARTLVSGVRSHGRPGFERGEEHPFSRHEADRGGTLRINACADCAPYVHLGSGGCKARRGSRKPRGLTAGYVHVIVSWFFRDVLDLDAHEEEAMELAGFLSPTVAERLAATLPCETEFESPQSPSTTEDES